MGLRERLDRAAEMPHRNFAGDHRLDARLVSELGRLLYRGIIGTAEHESGVRYGNLGVLYLQTIDAPNPYDGDLAALEDDICFRRKVNFISAREVLKSAGKRCVRIVDRVAIYDEPTRNEDENNVLRIGLRALCGFC